jgi:hypothetical protein
MHMVGASCLRHCQQRLLTCASPRATPCYLPHVQGTLIPTSYPASGKPLYASTYEDCCSECVKRPTCKFYTWNQTSYMCALRTGPVSMIAVQGAFSGTPANRING